MEEEIDTLRPSTSKPHFVETAFQKQKKLIQLKMMEYKDKGYHLQRPDMTEKSKQIIFNDLTESNELDWEYAIFDTIYSNNEEVPVEIKEFKKTDIIPSNKGIELSRLAFLSKETLNVIGLSINIDVIFTLKEESSIWIFLRSANKFDTETVVVKINKEGNSQKCFISLGTYVKDKNNKSLFKVFTRQQLVDFQSKILKIESKSKIYSEGDICDFLLTINDSFEDKLVCKVFVNNNQTPNEVTSEFFIPYIKANSIMIAGSGKQVLVKNLRCECTDKSIPLDNEIKSCDCCKIF